MFEEPLALEALRQAQELIRSQSSASASLDSKSASVMQASITLCTAALAAGALSLPGVANAWMPAWAGVGFFAAAVLWMASAALAAWSLRGAPENASTGIDVDRMVKGRLYEVTVAAAYLAIAISLNDSAERTRKTVVRSAVRLYRAVVLLLLAPGFGFTVALSVWRGGWDALWLFPILAVPLAVLGFFRALRGDTNRNP